MAYEASVDQSQLWHSGSNSRVRVTGRPSLYAGRRIMPFIVWWNEEHMQAAARSVDLSPTFGGLA